MAKAVARLEAFETALAADVIGLKQLRTLVCLQVTLQLEGNSQPLLHRSMLALDSAHGGIPDRPGVRSLCWKLLLDYLPPERARWAQTLKQQRSLYQTFLQEFIIDTQKMDEQQGATVIDPLGACSSSAAAADDDDSTAGAKPRGSKWDIYFKENEILSQIHKDVLRLCPEFAFFQGLSDRPRPLNLAPLHSRVGQQSLETETLVSSRSGVPLKRSSSGAMSAAPTLDGDSECVAHKENPQK